MLRTTIVFSIILVTTLAHSHNESPSYKYSRHANEQAQRKVDAGQNTHGHSHSHSHGEGHSHDAFPKGTAQEEARASGQPDNLTTIWVKAIGSTIIISVAPFIILVFIPISERSGHEDFLKVLLSFASGSLLGDAFLHLIPHALSIHNDESATHGHSHDNDGHGHSHNNSVGICVVLGILAFLAVEKFVRVIKGNHQHEHCAPSQYARLDEKKKRQKDQKTSDTASSNEHKKCTNEKKIHHDESTIRVAAYLNLAADFAHNFTDGLAIGASFLAGNTAGLVSTMTILLHEVPHEIGDFAILIQSGMSKRKAMGLQLVTAIGCLSGTIISLMAQEVGAANWILPFTAGGFIYIATVSVIPELLENSRFWQSVREIIALVMGVGMMMLLTEFE